MNNELQVATVQFCHRANDKSYNLGHYGTLYSSGSRRRYPHSGLSRNVHYRLLARYRSQRRRGGSLAEPIDDSPSARIARPAQSYQMAIGVGLIERASDDRLYNTYVVCMPDGQRHIHRKLHAFEHPAIDRGDSFTVFDTPWEESWRSDLLGQ